MDTHKDATIKDFETAIAKLERIVKQLEDGDLRSSPRWSSTNGACSCHAICHGRLEEAERRIEILNERGELRPRRRLISDDDPRR